MMITDDDLKRWQALCDAATPGPWVVGAIRRTKVRTAGEPCTHPHCPDGALLSQTDRYHWHHDVSDYEPWNTISSVNPTCLQKGLSFVAGAFDYEPGGIAEPADAAFIAEARTALPALIAEVRRLRVALEGVSDGHGDG